MSSSLNRRLGALGLISMFAACGDEASTLDGIRSLPAGWTRIEPGGRTLCARGEPFAFFVRPGAANRVVIELQDGGACYDAQRCATGSTLFRDRLGNLAEHVDEAVAMGLSNHRDPRNPVRDWHHVFIPYCTGDLHWGDADREYAGAGGSFTIRHRGAVNVRAALSWVFANVRAPEAVLVTGSSAGALGSIVWAPHVARQYPRARVVQLADSNVGVMPDGLIERARAQWNPQSAFPSFIPGADYAATDTVEELYQLVARGYPAMQLGAYTTRYDWNIYAYYALSSDEDVDAWAARARDLLGRLQALPRFRSYVAPGSVHMILPRNDLWQREVGGARFSDWLGAHLAGTAANVDCAPRCGGPMYGEGAAGWACVGASAGTPPPVSAVIDVALAIYREPLPRLGEDRDDGGMLVRACARADLACDAPLASATTNRLGWVNLSLPGGAAGFDGYLLVTHRDAWPTRIVFAPPLRDAQHPMALGNSYLVPTRTGSAALATVLGLTGDPSRGAVIGNTLDCNLSWRRDARLALDGAAPTTYLGGGPSGVGPTVTSDPLWASVAPGPHRVTLRREVDAAAVGEVAIDVVAGAVTVVAGVSPTAVQP